MVRDCIFCLQEATLQLIFKKHLPPKNPAECFVNPPCGCPNPGKELQCEDCEHLEACLSSFKKVGMGDWKLGISKNCSQNSEF